MTSKPGGRQKALIAAFLFALAMPFPLIANSDADISNKQMTLCRTAVLCAGLASAVAVRVARPRTAINADGYGCRQRGGDDAAGTTRQPTIMP